MKSLLKKRFVMLCLVSASATSFAATCDDLGRLPYKADFGIGVTVSEIVTDMLRNTSWKADVKSNGQEPVVTGKFSGSVSQILEKIVSNLEKSGVNVNYRVYGDECRVLIAMRDPAVKKVAASSTGNGERAANASALTSSPPDSISSQQGEWTLQEGAEIHKELARWAEKAGWLFDWKPKRTWIIPAPAKFSGSFEDAISAVIEGLYAQGKGVRLVLWEGNRFAEVIEVDGYAR